MKPFLAGLSQQLYRKYEHNLQEVTVIFPNRRAGLFFRKYLSGFIEKPVWAPQILNIDEFVKGFSSLQGADHLTLLFLLFDSYKKAVPVRESFDQFYAWGEMLLRDFNEIDKNLINARDLFTDLKNQKDIEQQFSYLTEEQAEIIKSFWRSFGDKPSRHQQDFLKVWHLLERVYTTFREKLEHEGLGYDGMVFRAVAEMALREGLNHGGRPLVFAGFNVLTKAEEAIIASFLKQPAVEMYWDIDQYYFTDKNQEAGHFLRKYAADKRFSKTFPEEIADTFRSVPKEIEIVGVPLAVGQAKLLGETLKRHFDEQQEMTPEKTAIVLPDEQMLFPVLHALPTQFKDINITMGYPLRDTPLYGFLEHLLDLQQNIRVNKLGKVTFYYENIVLLLKHPYFSQYNSRLASGLIRTIETSNKIHLEIDDLTKDYFYQEVFRQVKNAEEVFDYLLDILLKVNGRIGHEKEERDTLVEKEYIFHFYTQLKRLKEIVTSQQVTFTLQTFVKLFRQIIYALKLPFSGEPLNGLQVMGVLETRNLDFENVYILSMNEGKFPPGLNQSSFIPFNLRKGYNLPTYEQQDSIYAYNFYRLIQRAKKIFLFYNTESGIQTGGEMSRFLYQLRYESPVKAKESILSNPIKVPFPVPITIPKDVRVLSALEEYCLNEPGGLSKRSLTPSALNVYLDCRLKFYFRYVLRLFESDSIQEEIDAAVFGNMLHDVMEKFYKNILERKGNNMIEGKDLEDASLLEEAVINAFARHFHWEKTDDIQFEGRNLIVKEIMLKMGKEIVKSDIAYTPFYILGLEAGEEAYKVSIPVTTATGQKMVAIKGIIDRVDLKENLVRVIDYKTGKDNKRFESIHSLFDRDSTKRNKAAMQTLIYSLLYEESGHHADHTIMPGLYNARELFGNNFSIHLLLKNEENRKYEPVIDARPLFEELKIQMGKLLEEVYDPAIPFDQTNNLRICGYCPYAGICHR